MKSKRRSRRKNNRKPLLYMLIIFLMALAWMNLSSKQTQTLHNERYVKTYEADVTLIKNEQVFYFDQKPSYLISSGTRISMNQLLAEQSVSTQGYASDKSAAINKAISHAGSSKKELDLSLIDSFDEDDKTKSQREIRIMLSALRYQSKSEEELKDILEKNSGASISSPTLKKIGSDYPGYVFFDDDGYEQVFTFSNMDMLSKEFLEEADEIADLNRGYGNNVLKVTDDDGVIIVAAVPKEVELQREALLQERKTGIYERLDEENLSSYIELLTERVDLLRGFPKVKFNMDDNEYAAYLIESIEEEEEKILVFMLKEMVQGEILSKRKGTADIYTYENQGYLVPSRSVFEKDGKSYVMVLSKGYLRRNVEVTVTLVDGSQVFLSRSENSNLSDGMQVLINP
ncbi:HlyD family efflux transporter periplasmic adaptor subunit [Alkalibacter saccharofermentans]|uniref:HlyD family efflux transporter periplasmic adaptor subunit n=1 Tax=Alkalibacter saccharofermentans TaxID=235931 RepID=UPI0009355B4B|nr:HlyD family efflux transporter periplasmic adaptor subunit [Alkalibacter saccharofermentans]